MNTAIRNAVKAFNDPKIAFIDIDSALEGHRFCEPGASLVSQFNWGNDVLLWNNPAKWIVTINDGTTQTNYDDPQSAPVEIVEKLIHHQEERVKEYSDREFGLTFRDPAHPELVMEWVYVVPLESDEKEGLIARTLHPTQLGHEAIGVLVAQALESHYHCPAGCTCSPGSVPLCF